MGSDVGGLTAVSGERRGKAEGVALAESQRHAGERVIIGVGNDRERTVRAGLARICAEMLAGHDDGLLGRIEIERRLVLEATRDLNRAVANARGGGIAWEQIADTSRASWRLAVPAQQRSCSTWSRWTVPVTASVTSHGVAMTVSDLVLHHGTYGGHPLDVESGHRAAEGRLLTRTTPASLCAKDAE